jgi:hypothetical protein
MDNSTGVLRHAHEWLARCKGWHVIEIVLRFSWIVTGLNLIVVVSDINGGARLVFVEGYGKIQTGAPWIVVLRVFLPLRRIPNGNRGKPDHVLACTIHFRIRDRKLPAGSAVGSECS